MTTLSTLSRNFLLLHAFAIVACGGKIEAVATPDANLGDAAPSSDVAPVAVEGQGGCSVGSAGAVTSLSLLPRASLCALNRQLYGWTCGGSLLITASNDDLPQCASSWFFDGATHALQEVSHSCGEDPECVVTVGGAPPLAPCTPENRTDLCPDGASFVPDPPPLGDFACVVNDVATYDTSCASDSDCALITTGILCDDACACETSAVNASGRARAAAAVAAVQLAQCDCLEPTRAVCASGTCQIDVPLLDSTRTSPLGAIAHAAR